MKQTLHPAGFPTLNKYIVKIAFGKAITRRITICKSGLKVKPFLLLVGLIICQTFCNTISAQNYTLEELDAIASEKKTMLLLEEAETWYLRNSDSARSYSNAALQMAQYLENDSLIAKGHRIMGISHYYSGNFMLFAEHCEYGLETKYASNNRQFAAKLWNNLGIAYEMLADFDNAIYAYNKSMELERLLQNESGYHVTQINLGLLHSKTGNSARGLDILESALEYFIAQNDSLYIALTYQNIGKIHHDQRNHPFYDEFAVKALEIYELLGDTVKMSDVYYNRAVNARSNGDFENWEYFLNRASELQPPNIFRESHIIHEKGKIALHKGNYAQAEKYVKQAFENFIELESIESQRSVYMTLLKLYAHKGDLKMHDQLLFEFENHIEQSLSEAMLKRYAELDLKYENTRSKQQLQQYQYLNEQQSKTIMLLRLMLIISILLTLIFAGLAYSFRSNRKKN